MCLSWKSLKFSSRKVWSFFSDGKKSKRSKSHSEEDDDGDDEDSHDDDDEGSSNKMDRDVACLLSPSMKARQSPDSPVSVGMFLLKL